MANKKISSKENPLVSTHIHLPMSVKNDIEALGEKTGKSMSDIIRGWAKIHLDSPEAEINELEKERLEHEAHIQSINAQITELKASDQRRLLARSGKSSLKK